MAALSRHKAMGAYSMGKGSRADSAWRSVLLAATPPAMTIDFGEKSR